MEVLNVHAYDWVIKNDLIYCWALDRSSIPHLLIIDNFPTFCMIELPVLKNFTWSLTSLKTLVIDLNRQGCKIKADKLSLLFLKNIYYYEGSNKRPYFQAHFNNTKDLKRCKYKLDNCVQSMGRLIKLNMWEDTISSVRKLLTFKNVGYSNWFQVEGLKVNEDEHISSLDYEYHVDWTTMAPILDCEGWTTSPGILSWDIECYSHNHLAFPNKYNDKDVVYMISAIYKRHKDDDSIKRYGILIGECDPITLPNTIIITVHNEVELVEAFGRVIKETDPEILLGYNIFSFDYPYLNHRLLRQIHLWPKMGRLLSDQPRMSKNNFSSKAYGHNPVNTLNISGRISIDLLPVMKRDYKLESNTLNYVCKKFIGKEKFDVTPKQMFEYYEQLVDAIKNNDNIKDARAKMTEVMLYCIQDAELVIQLMEKLDIWVGLIELSNIAGVTVLEIFTKGQQIRCLSQLYNLAVKQGYVINGRDAPTYGFKGGSVQKPIPGLYENIICLDFKSLYPSIIQALNICYTTLIHPTHYHLVPDSDCHVIEFDQEIVRDSQEGVDEGDSEESEEEKKSNVIVKHYKLKFYKHQIGLLPMLVKNLVSERNAVRQQQKGKSEQIKMILEKRQLALKCCSNSIFGFLGVREGGKLPLMEGAMSITAKGRELIADVGKYLKEKYNADIVYGDSVTHDTPILICDYLPHYRAIEDLGEEWVIYNDKEVAYTNFKVWSDQGWTKIHKVIRHKTNKIIYRIITNLGSVDVTSDHSLLNELGEKMRPNEVNIGDQLLHTRLPDVKLSPINLPNEQLTAACDFYNSRPDSRDYRIKNIIILGQTDQYVYDLETDNHHFCAGVGQIVVHNTDSVMVNLNIKDKKECQYWGERLAQEISGVKIGDFLPNSTEKHLVNIPGLFLKPLEMEFEKAMLLFCIKPKMYAAYLINKKGEYIVKNNEFEMLTRGIPLVRRDKIILLKFLYKSILDKIMQRQPFKEVMTLLIDTIIKLLDGQIGYEDLTSSRELNVFYKQPSFYMKIFSDELKRKNKMVNPGERLAFVVIDNKEELLGKKMMLVEDYKSSPCPIDYMYYLEKVLANPLDCIISIGYQSVLAKLTHIQYKPGNKRKPITLSNPVEMMFHMVKNKQSLITFRALLLQEIDKISVS